MVAILCAALDLSMSMAIRCERGKRVLYSMYSTLGFWVSHNANDKLGFRLSDAEVVVQL